MMTSTKQAEIAMHNLILARIVGNEASIRCWMVRLDYWTERIVEESRAAVGHPDLIT